MNNEHKQLADGRWQELSFFEQMANIGSEVFRAIKWRNKGNNEYADHAFDRALELYDLTVDDEKNKSRLREVLRSREVLVDYFVGDNSYNSDEKKWQNYFFAFNFAARV